MKNLFIAIFLFSPLFLVAQEAAPANADEALQDTVKLKEVVVKVSRPISKIEGDGFVTQIQGSVLQELGTAKDVLGFIPGIQNNNGAISVIGCGVPTIYINGRMVRTGQELDQLRADKMKTVKLITNPGARYDGQTNAVIRITTVKNLGDGFALDSRTSLSFRNYLGGKEDLSLNYRHNNLDIFGTLEYDYNKGKGTMTDIQDSWLKTHNRSLLNTDAHRKSQIYDGKIGFNYSPSEQHHFGAFYHTSHQPARDFRHSASRFYQNDIMVDNSWLSSSDKSTDNEHLIDAYYNGTWGGWEADFTFDALWRNSDENQRIRDMSTSESREMLLKDKSRGRLLAGELHLTHSLWRGSIGFGGQYSNSDRKDNFLGDEALISSSNNRINEGNLGLYVELSQNFNWVIAQVGVRYEHIYSNYFENAVKMHEQSRKYNELLPSVNLIFPIKKAMLQLGYSRKYRRPLYSQLSSTVTYYNQYQYESGNPFLKTPFSDIVTLNFRWNWLTLMCRYKHVDNLIISSASAYNGSESITLMKKDNSPYASHNIELVASFVPGLIKNIYYPVLSLIGQKQFLNVNYRGGIKKMNRPMYMVNLQNMFMLPNNYMLTASLNWRSKFDAENITMHPTWNIDLRAQKKFGKHWSVELSANDIFNTADKNHFIMYSGAWGIDIEKINTSRNFMLTVGYKFNTTKSKYKGKGAAKEEQERL